MYYLGYSKHDGRVVAVYTTQNSDEGVVYVGRTLDGQPWKSLYRPIQIDCNIHDYINRIFEDDETLCYECGTPTKMNEGTVIKSPHAWPHNKSHFVCKACENITLSRIGSFYA